MVVSRLVLSAACLLPALAWAQDPLITEREWSRKAALVEATPPLDRGELGLMLPPEVDALTCAVPCVAGNLAASHPYYDVFLNCGSGAFTARTGASHSVTLASGGPQNVIFGGQGGGPGTSDVTFFVHETGSQYTNPAGGATCLFDPPDTLAEPASVGLEQEWSVTNSPGMSLTFRQELVAFGDTEANSGVRMTLGVTNTAASTVPATIGMRWQIDYQNGSDDGPLLAPVICDPPTVEREFVGEHDLAPSEIKDFYRIRNNTGFPIFSNVTSTTPLSGIANTSRPDRLVFGVWGSLRNSAWGYAAAEGNAAVDADSAVLYYFGYQAADGFVLAPGESITRTVVIFTSSAGIDCGDFEPGCAPSVTNPPADQTICIGDSARLDASGLGLTDCLGTIEYEWSDPLGVIGTGAVLDVSPLVDTDYSCSVSCSTDLACFTRESVTVTVEAPPQLDFAVARDADPCNEGLIVDWDPALFGGPSSAGVYNVYRSTLSCADALASPPLVTGLTGRSWFDGSTTPGVDYHYVVEAEDARMPTACALQGPHNGGAVDRVCLAPVFDESAEALPDGIGAVLFLSHVADTVELRWDGARALEAGEHFHVLKQSQSADETFFMSNFERDVSTRMIETDRVSRLQFFDVRVADRCESLSLDEFPPR